MAKNGFGRKTRVDFGGLVKCGVEFADTKKLISLEKVCIMTLSLQEKQTN